MDRGIKDEAFVRRALHEADFDMGRWIANQAVFNGADNAPLEPSVKAALVTAASIYVQKYDWPEQTVRDALAVSSCGDARAFIDRVWSQLPDVSEHSEL